MSRPSMFLLVFLSIFFTTYAGNYSLSKISTLYIPYYDEDGNATYGYDKSTIEQIDYDPISKLVYAVGANILHVIDASDPKKMKILHHQIYENIDVTDIELCGDYVFFAMDNMTTSESRMNGSVQVLKKYQKGASDSLKVLHQIQVGAIPDMIKPTKDCKTVLVAVEGEAYGKSENFRDPQGGVGIIRFPDGVEEKNTYVELDFTEFNDKVDELSKEGVRFIYRENNNTFDRDVEPEYITYNSDESIAYICLQENNAIAEVDLKTTKITKIHGLGYKSWDKVKLDPSDEDDGINLATYDIRSFYQPDSIHYDNWLGKNIIITANEGETKDYEDLIDWKDTKRGKKLEDEVSDKVSETVKEALDKKSKLGRLLFSRYDGLNPDNNDIHDYLYAFGGRSMTIRLASDMSVLYDSGSVIEEQLAEYYPEIFNSNGNDRGDSTPISERDSRSPKKGPECETLETARLDGKLLIFLGSEKPGIISIFSVGDDFSSTTYESTYTGIPAYNLTFNEMYEKRILSEIDPEDIKYVPASNSPNKKPVLFVAGSVSCTLSILQIEGVDQTNGVGTVLGSGSGPLTIVISLLIVSLYHLRL